MISKLLFWSLLICSCAVVFLGIDRLAILWLGSMLPQWSQEFPASCKVCYSLSLGYIVSAVFYVVVVYLPDRKKRRDIRPYIDIKLQNISARLQGLISNTVKYSRLSYDPGKITKEEFQEVCRAVNPKEVSRKFHTADLGIFSHHHGFACWNDWMIAMRDVDEILRHMPYVDTRLVAVLNELKSCYLVYCINDLKNVEKLGNLNMSSWAEAIFNAANLGRRLLKYSKHSKPRTTTSNNGNR